MTDYMLLGHNDDSGPTSIEDWGRYIAKLRATGNFEGGSAIGGGICVRKTGAVPAISEHLTGFIRITANNLEHAKSLVVGNPGYEAGGTIEIRELPKTD